MEVFSLSIYRYTSYVFYSLPTAVTLALADAGFTLSGSEGSSIDVCVNITQDAPGGRQCPVDVTLTYAALGVKPGNGMVATCSS